MSFVSASRFSRWSQKNPVLWTPSEDDPVPDPVLLDRHARGQLGTDDGPAREVLGHRDPFVDMDTDVLCSEPFGDQGEDGADALIHAEAEDFGREHVIEPVDDEAGKAVPLGVEHAVGVRDRLEAEGLVPQGDGPIDPVRPELQGGRVDALREEAKADLRRCPFQRPKPNGRFSRSTTRTMSPSSGRLPPTGPITILR